MISAKGRGSLLRRSLKPLWPKGWKFGENDKKKEAPARSFLGVSSFGGVRISQCTEQRVLSFPYQLSQWQQEGSKMNSLHLSLMGSGAEEGVL